MDTKTLAKQVNRSNSMMEVNTSMNSNSNSNSNSNNSQESTRNDNIIDDHDDGPLPGFRFHPTDEELVSFYLKRKFENRRPLSIEIIKQIDIYKHDPWDLAKASSSIGDKEWYFYCKRGRKYRNSIRPNRVTGSGFWKATGIDKPIYSNGGQGHECIGLKKSLVYYRGSAGKGTKTDWMMHEFRLPTDQQQQQVPNNSNNEANVSSSKDTTTLEAEIWTLCRIFKRSKRQVPDWRELSTRKSTVNSFSTSKTTTIIDSNNIQQECYINFSTTSNNNHNNNNNDNNNNNANFTNNIYVANNEHNNNNYNNNNSNNVYLGNHTNTTGDLKTNNNNVPFVHANHQQQQQWNNPMSMAHHHNHQSCTSLLRPSMLNNNHHAVTNNSEEQNNDMQSYAQFGHNWDDLNSVVQFAVNNNNKPFQ